MGKQSQYRYSMYCGEGLGEKIEQALQDRDQSESEFLREAARRELQRMEVDA